jgi:hypothetical protein
MSQPTAAIGVSASDVEVVVSSVVVGVSSEEVSSSTTAGFSTLGAM